MTPATALVLDFDSTFVTVEALERLAAISLADDPERDARMAEISRLTELAMNGDIGFAEALRRRVALLKIRREHLGPLIDDLKAHVSPSLRRNRETLQAGRPEVFIVTGGFHDYVDAVVAGFGIPPERVRANRLVFDDQGLATGVDEANPLARDGGKIEAVRGLGAAEVVMVGDGWTDYQVREAGAAARFYAFTETAARSRVIAAADRVAASFDEVLHQEGVSRRWSFPRGRMKVLLLENIHSDAARLFRDEGYEVEIEPGALDETALAQRLAGVSVLGIRSRTRLTATALQNADRLLAVGAFCIGTNQIDLNACGLKGVAAFNAPYSNTRSVVELAIGEIIALVRRLFDKSAAAHRGQWDKAASGAREVRGQTLGIIGYGAIGSQLSVVAEAIGLRVIYWDLAEKLTLGNARRCRSLDELLAASDIVSLHVDGRTENRNLIGERELAQMKPEALLINLSRGQVVDLEALARALQSGALAGAGIDVFPEEPESNGAPFVSVLQGLPNVILSPHIGGSTDEAQAAIAGFASERLLGFLHRGDTTFSVNLPNVQLSEVTGAHRLLHIHRNRPGVLAGINRILADGGLNILAQHLKTSDEIGFVITDVDRNYSPQAIRALREAPDTVKFRVIY